MEAAPPDRLVILGDSRALMSAVLLEAALEAVAAREDVEVVAVVDGGHQGPLPAIGRFYRGWAVPRLKRLFDRKRPLVPHRGATRNLHTVARRFRVPVVVPPERNLNHPDFRSEIEALRPTLGLSLGCLQILGEDLLATLGYAVNCHNGLLPEYRGLWAPQWSIYRGESEAGFTFHRIDERIDTGPILLTGSLPVAPGADPMAVSAEVTRLAATRLPEILDRMRRREPGWPQEDPGSYFGAKALRRVRRIADPGEHDLAELELRLRCFQELRLNIAGAFHPVTALRERSRGGRWSFETRDGVRVAAARLAFLPPSLYRLLRPLRLVPRPE